MEEKLKAHIVELLEGGRVVEAKWACGLGIPQITIYLDDDPLEDNNAFAVLLSEQLANRLDLPEEETLQLNGKGQVFLKSKQLLLVCESRWKVDNKKANDYSGKINLFK